jgi:hypothetical protein
VHCPGFDTSRDEHAVRAAVQRLDVRHPVLIDSELQLWRDYENEGWPARYLFDGHARLFEYHYGEGAYAETELAIQQLLGVEREPLAPLSPADAPGALLAAPTDQQPGAYCGPYEGGGVWAVLDGAGTVRASERRSGGAVELQIDAPGAYRLLQHERHTAGELALELQGGLRCEATCFAPGVA